MSVVIHVSVVTLAGHPDVTHKRRQSLVVVTTIVRTTGKGLGHMITMVRVEVEINVNDNADTQWPRFSLSNADLALTRLPYIGT